MQEETNIFTGKTVDEAIDEGLKTLGITLADAEIEILEEGKKKLIGSVKAKVRITKQGKSDAKRASEFVDGILEILGLKGVSEIVSDDDNIVININTTESAKVIGKHGDVLDSIQCMAGAIANKDKDEYKKVIVDCENYRAQREETLVALAHKVANKAVETGRKVILEPMSPYERRIIHSTLSDSTEVKTVSEGNEPVRHIAVIPNGAKPYDRGIRFGFDRRGGDRRENDRRGGRGERGDRGGRRGNDRGGDRRESRPRSSGSAPRGKREIHFGTFLGNSKDLNNEENKD